MTAIEDLLHRLDLFIKIAIQENIPLEDNTDDTLTQYEQVNCLTQAVDLTAQMTTIEEVFKTLNVLKRDDDKGLIRYGGGMRHEDP